MPVFDMIETVMVKKLHFAPSTTLRFIVRNVYVGKQPSPSPSLPSLSIFLLLMCPRMVGGITNQWLD